MVGDQLHPELAGSDMLGQRFRAAGSAAIAAIVIAGILLVASLELSHPVAAAPVPSPTPSVSGDCQPPNTWDPGSQTCIISIQTPGSPASTPSSSPTKGGGGSDGTPKCYYNSSINGSVEVPCYDKGFGGWYDSTAGCYFKLMSPQPPPSDPIWAGHPSGGAVYDSKCYTYTKVSPMPVALPLGPQWLATPPPSGPGPTAAQLAAEAQAKLVLQAPAIGIAPTPGGSGLVGMPVWLWITQTPQTWGPQSQTAAVPGLSVTATANGKTIAWDMGDGHTVTCQDPGTQYAPSDGGAASPNCGYTYTQPSGGHPNGEYTITATTTWQVSWVASNGQTGTLPPVTTPPSTITLKIGELQVVNH